MGAVDLVIQVESPKSVARGLQRVGRAGHDLQSVSRGRIFPKFRADLLECAVVARAMREGAIEETRIPRNTLDVLSQQIVAICADEEVSVDELHALVRRAYPFSDLSRPQLENVLDMLAGRYPSDEFAELRPRIVWDRTAGVVRGRTGARRLAVTNAGTIPDRGLFGVHLVGDGGRVGELDEEMVYEAREGQTFVLGASTWRIEDITRDRVLVSPAPGVPGVAPFWKGEGVGRPAELGEKIGRASRELVAALRRQGGDGAPRRVSPRQPGGAKSRHVSARAGGRDRRRPLRSLDRRRALPRRDRRLARLRADAVRRTRARALGDGARGAAQGLARHRRAVDLVGRRHRAPLPRCRRAASARRPPARPGRHRGARHRGARSVGALRVALPGERLARAAHPASPSRPAHAALAAAVEGAEPACRSRAGTRSSRSCSRRIASACRTSSTCPRCAGSCKGIQTRELDLVEVETASASPFASSLLFDYVATYMYEDDTPPEERRAQALSLDRGLLRELMGVEELRELLDLGAIEQVEASLLLTPRNADELHDLLRRAGPAVRRRVRPRLRRDALARAAGDPGSAGRHGAVGRRRGCGARSRRLRRGAARRRPERLPRAGARRTGGLSCGATHARTGRSRPPRLRLGSGSSSRSRRAELAELERDEKLVRGELRPGGSEREWCDPDVLRRIRRATLAVLRREVEPADQAALGRFLPAWHGIGRRQTLREALVPLQGLALPVSLWESDVLPRRVPSYRPADLDALCASGDVVWVGAGLDRVAVYFREDAELLGPPAVEAAPEGVGPGRDSRRARRRRALLGRSRRQDRARARRRTGGSLGSRLGGRGDERLVGAASRLAPLRRAASRAEQATFPALAHERAVADAGQVVARGLSLPGETRPPGAGRAPARAAGNRHA